MTSDLTRRLHSRLKLKEVQFREVCNTVLPQSLKSNLADYVINNYITLVNLLKHLKVIITITEFVES